MVNYKGFEMTEAQIELVKLLEHARSNKKNVEVHNYVSSEGEEKSMIFTFSSWQTYVQELGRQVKALSDMPPIALAKRVVGFDLELLASCRLQVLDGWQKKMQAFIDAGASAGSVSTRGPVYLALDSDIFLAPGNEKIYVRNVIILAEKIITPAPVRKSKPETLAKKSIIKLFSETNRPDFQLGLNPNSPINLL